MKVKYYTSPLDLEPQKTAEISENTICNALHALGIVPTAAPTLAVVGDTPILEKHWHIPQPQPISIYTLPADPVSLVIAVVTFIAQPIVPTLVSSVKWYHMAAVVLGGSYLLQQKFAPAAATDYAGNPSSSSPTYSITARGNRYRPGEPKTEIFGKVRTYPSYIVRPYTRFINNEQYLYEVFHVAQGNTSESSHKIGNSEMGSAADGFYLTNYHNMNKTNVSRHPEFLKIKHIVENTQRELFALNEKGKLRLTKYYGVGTHTASVPHDIEIDLVAPNGLANSAGSSLQVKIRIHYYSGSFQSAAFNGGVGNYGHSIKYTRHYTELTIKGDGRNAVRVTVKMKIIGNTPAGIRLERIDNKDTHAAAAHAIYLVAIRKVMGLLPSGNTGEVILLRTKATEVSQGARGKFSVIAHNRLPPFDKPNNTPILSNSIADAAAYILRKYLPDANIDLATLAKLDIEWKKRGDTVNGVFDTSTNAWEALKKVLACGRTQPVRLWDSVSFVRDAEDITPQLMFDMNSIEQNSLKISHRLTGGETANGVRIFFLDAKDDYEENSVTYWEPNSPKDRIVDIRMPFVTDKAQAEREAKYKARENMYRRKTVTFIVPTPPLPLLVGSAHILRHPLVAAVNAQGFVVRCFKNADGVSVLELSAPVDWQAGKSYAIRLTDTKGIVSGSIAITEDPDYDTYVRLSQPLGFDIRGQRGGNGTPSAFVVNETTIQNDIVRISTVKPLQGGKKVEITAFFDDYRVHAD